MALERWNKLPWAKSPIFENKIPMAKEQITKEEVDKLKKFYDETRQEFGKQLLRELREARKRAKISADDFYTNYVTEYSMNHIFASHNITLED